MTFSESGNTLVFGGLDEKIVEKAYRGKPYLLMTQAFPYWRILRKKRMLPWPMKIRTTELGKFETKKFP